MKKLRVEEVIVVEGKYDAVKLADLVDGLILTTNGFSVFKNAETKRLLVERIPMTPGSASAIISISWRRAYV